MNRPPIHVLLYFEVDSEMFHQLHAWDRAANHAGLRNPLDPVRLLLARIEASAIKEEERLRVPTKLAPTSEGA